MRKQAPASRTKTGAHTTYTVVRTTDGRTFKVPEHKAKRFAARIEGRTQTLDRSKERSLTRNQWGHSPCKED